MPLQSKFAVEDLPEEILLSVFKHLEPYQIPDSRRICSRWLKVIDENKSLWRIVDDIDNLELFDYKSESSLTEVSFTFYEARRREYEESGYNDASSDQDFNEDEDDVERLYNTLLKSSETLRLVNIDCRHPEEVTFRGNRSEGISEGHTTLFWSLSELAWQLPSLEDFRLTGRMDGKDEIEALRSYPNPLVQLVKSRLSSKPASSNNQKETPSHSSRLKVLWIDFSEAVFASHVGGDGVSSLARKGFLNNLSSLSTWNGASYEAECWREVLKVPSQSLKHLRIGFAKGKDHVPVLDFPKLEVFEFLGDTEYLNWIIIPKTTILIILSIKVPSGLPNVSEIWSRANEVDSLSNTCPSLETLKLGECRRESKEYGNRHTYVGDILQMVKERIQKEAAGIEIDGTKMKSIKSLAFGFEIADYFEEGEEAFDELKKLVQLSDNKGELEEPIIEI